MLKFSGPDRICPIGIIVKLRGEAERQELAEKLRRVEIHLEDC